MSAHTPNQAVIDKWLMIARETRDNPPPENSALRDMNWAITYAWALDVLARYGTDSEKITGDPKCPNCGSSRMVHSKAASYWTCFYCSYGYEETEYQVKVQVDHTDYVDITDIRYGEDPDGIPTIIIDIT